MARRVYLTASTLALVIAGSAFGWSSSAAAQDRTEIAAQDISDIVVTARKRVESIQEVPISITAISGAEIAARGSVRIRDLALSVPNVNFFNTSTSLPVFSVRGILNQSRVSPGFESTVGVYVDGVVIGRLTGFSQELYDVERVEFLRGPQGTLFGRNAIAGAINIVTRSPGDRLRFDAEGQIGQFGQRGVKAYVGGPISGDTLGASLSVTRLVNDGYQYNVATGRGADTENLWAARAKVVAKPAPGVEVTLAGDLVRDRSYSQVPHSVSGYGFTPDIDQVNDDVDAKSFRDIYGASLTTNVDVSSNAVLTFVGGYRSLGNLRTSDGDGGPISGSYTVQDVSTKQWSGELRLQSKGSGPIQYVAGVFAFDQTARNRTDGCGGTGLPVIYQSCGITTSRVDTRSLAAFANVDWRVVGPLTLTAGLRYTNERKKLAANQIASPFTPNIAPETDQQNDNDWSPTVGAKLQVMSNVMLYATVSRGYRSGGWNTEIVSGQPASFAARKFGSENLWNYEAGLKSQFWNNRITLNVAVFRSDYSNMQVARLEPLFAGSASLVSFITNAGRSRIDGTEVEGQLRVLPGVLISGGFGLLNARYLSYTDTVAGVLTSFAGNKLDYVPGFTGNVSLDVQQPVGGGLKAALRLDYNDRSSFYRVGGRLNGTADLIEGFALLNGRVGLIGSKGRWEVFAFGENLMNRRPVQGTLGGGLAPFTPTGINIVYGRPRYLGLRAAIHI